MVNLIEDLNQLTTIPTKALTKLNQKSIMCINNALAEALVDGNNEVSINIGIGNLYILVENNKIKYGFEPNPDLSNSNISTVKHKRNLLNEKLEVTLVDRITKTYKDLI